MFHKEDLVVVKKRSQTDFNENFIVYFTGLTDTLMKYYELRVTKKSEVIARDEQEIIKEEWRIRSEIRCYFIVNVISTFQDYYNLYYLTEFPLGGFLYFYLRENERFTKEIAQFYFAEILLGVQYLHAKNICYRFLNPENIMITCDGHIKLRFDYINCIGLSEEMFKENIEYIPIDYIKNKESVIESDYWSLGVILYEMLVGYSPFLGNDYLDTMDRISNADYEIPSFVDPDSYDILVRLLEKSKYKRFGHNENDRYLIRLHPFFNGLNWVDIASLKSKPPIKPVPDKSINHLKAIKLIDMFSHDKNGERADGYGNIFRYYGRKYERKQNDALLQKK